MRRRRDDEDVRAQQRVVLQPQPLYGAVAADEAGAHGGPGMRRGAIGPASPPPGTTRTFAKPPQPRAVRSSRFATVPAERAHHDSPAIAPSPAHVLLHLAQLRERFAQVLSDGVRASAHLRFQRCKGGHAVERVLIKDLAAEGAVLAAPPFMAIHSRSDRPFGPLTSSCVPPDGTLTFQPELQPGLELFRLALEAAELHTRDIIS